MPTILSLSRFVPTAALLACSFGVQTVGGSGANTGNGSGSNGSGGTGPGITSGGSATGGRGGLSHNGGSVGSNVDGNPSTGGATVSVPGCGQASVGPVITDCGYPMSSNNPLTSVVFNESDVLRSIVPSGGSPTATIRVFYNDEHALTLGVRRVVVKTSTGTTMTDYPVSPLLMNPGSVSNPQTGTNALVGDESGLDPSLRPMWPALFITDISTDPNSRAGDWQQGGSPQNPNEVFGTWKGAVRTVDATKTPSVVTITPDADPPKNNWNLAAGDPAPAGLTDQGFGAEARWTIPLLAGHAYRVQAMVHDGDQSKGGGDTGQACVVFCAGGTPSASPPDAGTPPPRSCPSNLLSCGSTNTGVDTVSCPAGYLCANGCCLPAVP